MSRKKGTVVRWKYTQTFVLETVRPVKGRQSVPVTAKVLNMSTQTPGNWVRRSARGELTGLATNQSAHRPAAYLLPHTASTRASRPQLLR